MRNYLVTSPWRRIAYLPHCLLMIIFNPLADAATTMGASTKTINLQSQSAVETSFILPFGASITTIKGDGIIGDSSRRWLLTVQGVIEAAGNGISVYSPSSIITSQTGASVSGLIGLTLVSNNNIINSSGTITGTGGTAILLAGSGNAVTLGAQSVINGDILSAGSGNTLVLSGAGKVGDDIGGAKGFDAITVDGTWGLGGDVLLSAAPHARLTINDSGILVLTGTVHSYNNQTASLVINHGASLQIGTGGQTGDVKIPIFNDGILTFYHSDSNLTLTTPVSGDGVIVFRGTGVRGQSSYTLNSNHNTFSGNLVIGSGARLHVASSNPAPQAHIVVQNGGTLWLGSSAHFTSPLLLEGNGWAEGGGPYGALRLDSGAIEAGAITLTGDARIGAVFADYTGSITGVIDDAGKGYQLEKSGDGLITLAGNNTWTGGTRLTAGRLAVSADSNLGATSGAVTFNGGMLEMTKDFVSNRSIIVNARGGSISSAGTNTFAGDASGSGNLTVKSGKLVLAANDTRTGSTTINSGAALQVGSDSVNGATRGTLSGNVNNAGSLIFNRIGNATYSGILSGAGALIKQSTGLVNLSGAGSSQGSVAVNSGTLMFSPAGKFNVTGNMTTAAGATTSVAAPSQLNVAGTLMQQANATLETTLNTTQPAVVASAISLNGALRVNGVPGAASNITSKTYNILHSTTASGITGDFTSTGLTNPADYLISSGSKANNNQDYNLNFVLRWLGGPTQGNGDFTLVNQSDVFNLDTALGDQTGPFSSGWDGQSLAKAGAGTLILSRQNLFTGETLINSGTLQTDVADAFAQSSAVTVDKGATLKLNNSAQQVSDLSGAGTIALGNAALTVNSDLNTLYSGAITGTGSVVKKGPADLTLSGRNSFSGGMLVNGGTLIANNAAALGTGTVVNRSALTLDFGSISRVENVFSGNGVLNKEGNGIATLAKNGSSAGAVNVKEGAFNLGAGVEFTTKDFHSDVGTYTGIGDNGSLKVDNQLDLNGALAVVLGDKQPVVEANSVHLGSESKLNIVGLNLPDDIAPEDIFTRRFQILSTAAPNGIGGDFSSLQIGDSTTPVDFAEISGFKDLNSQNYSIGVMLNWYASHASLAEEARGTFTLADADMNFDLNVALLDQDANPLADWDGKTLTKAGEGTLTFSKQNRYTGSTLIQGGVLKTGINDALVQSSDVQIADGARLDLDSFDQSINNLSGSGRVSLGDATLSINNSTDTLFSGVIDGRGGMNKNGGNTLILNADNTYTGVTTINGGTLQLGDGGMGGSVNGDIVNNAALVVNNQQDMTFAHTMSGAGSVAKNAANNLQFLADQSYTGLTAINSGAIVLGSSPTASINLASSQVNIARGAALGGYGSVAGNVDNKGTLAVADALPQFANSPAGNLVIGGDLVNAGNIVMASPAPASSLTVKGDYTGNNGLLTLSTVLGDEHSASDKLVILGDSSGNTQVKVNNAGGVGAATINGVELISVAGHSDGKFTLAGRVVAGKYDYFLQKGLPGSENGNWYLRNELPPVDPVTPVTPVTPVPPTPSDSSHQVTRPEAGSYLANLAVAGNMFNQRLSDRNGRAEDSSLWLRQTGSRTGSYDNSGQLKTTTNSYVIQGGGEALQGQFFEQDRLGVGVMLGYGNEHNNTWSNRSGYSSKGQLNGYSSGVYATWYEDGLSREGTYVDSWLLYSWFKSSVNGEEIAQENYDINGFSGSLESGYRQGIYRSETSNVYLTPQAQLIWNGISADDRTESNGTVVKSQNVDNLQSRVGLRLSEEGVATRDKASGKLFTTYVETNWLHNTNLTGVMMNGDSIQQAGERNVGEIKLGIEGKLTQRFNMWGSVGQQMGSSGYHSVAGAIGMDYRF